MSSDYLYSTTGIDPEFVLSDFTGGTMAWLMQENEQHSRYKPPRVSDEQMLALEKFIAKSSNATEFAKKVIIWTLRQTQNLTRPVALSVWNKDYDSERTAEVQNGAHGMNSSNGKTHLGLFFDGMGTEMMLEHHCGCFEDRPGDPFNSKAAGRTIWISYIFYTRDVTRLSAPPLAEIEAIVLPTHLSH